MHFTQTHTTCAQTWNMLQSLSKIVYKKGHGQKVKGMRVIVFLIHRFHSPAGESQRFLGKLDKVHKTGKIIGTFQKKCYILSKGKRIYALFFVARAQQNLHTKKADILGLCKVLRLFHVCLCFRNRSYMENIRSPTSMLVESLKYWGKLLAPNIHCCVVNTFFPGLFSANLWVMFKFYCDKWRKLGCLFG